MERPIADGPNLRQINAIRADVTIWGVMAFFTDEPTA